VSGSQSSQFQEFLLRANKYNTLDIFGGSGGVCTRRIVLVEVCCGLLGLNKSCVSGNPTLPIGTGQP